MVGIKLRSVQVKPEHFKKFEIRAICNMCDHIAVRYYEELKPTIALTCLNCGNSDLVDSNSEQMIDSGSVELEQILQDNFNVNDKPVVHKASYNGITKQYAISTYKALFNMETFEFIRKVYGYKLIMFNMQSSALWFVKESKK